MSNRSKYLLSAGAIACVFIIGCGANTTSNATSTPSVSDQQDSNTTTTSQDSNTTSDSGKYNPDNPVPDSYLKDFLVLMDNYYKNIHATYHAGGNSDQVDWVKTLHDNNQQGWDKYNQITYKTDFDKEKSVQLTKRTDVAQAWVFLSSLSLDYDSVLKGDSTKDIASEEQQYEEQYNKAMDDLTQK